MSSAKIEIDFDIFQVHEEGYHLDQAMMVAGIYGLISKHDKELSNNEDSVYKYHWVIEDNNIVLCNINNEPVFVIQPYGGICQFYAKSKKIFDKADAMHQKCISEVRGLE